MMTTLADAWLHDLSPFLWRISGDFGLRWYGLSYLAGFVCGWLALRFLIARGGILLTKEQAIDAVVFAAIGAVVGGRLGYVAFYQPSLVWTFQGSIPFWGVLALNDGGMASHGGMIGVAVAAWLVARGPADESGDRPHRVAFRHMMDVFGLIAPFGLLLGRLANFINGELLGKIVARPGEPGPSWAVRYAQEIDSDHAPSLTREQGLALQTLLDDYRIDQFEPDGEVFARVMRGLQSGSADIAARIEPLVSARHPSQLYQALAEGVLLGLVVWLFAKRPRVPGQIAGVWLITYGIMRIVTEVYRLPDANLAMQRFAGLSRGQWLSVGMILIGVSLFAWVTKQGGERIGGWGRAKSAAG